MTQRINLGVHPDINNPITKWGEMTAFFFLTEEFQLIHIEGMKKIPNHH